MVIGRVYAERYRVEAILHEGALSVAYKAWAVDTGSPCTLHILRDEVSNSSTAAEQFMRIADRAAGVRQAALVEWQDYGIADDDSLYWAHSFTQERCLADVIKAEGGLEAAAVATLGVQVGRALATLHQSELYHGGLTSRWIWLPKGSASPARVSGAGLCDLLAKAPIPDHIIQRHDRDLLGLTIREGVRGARDLNKGITGDIHALGSLLFRAATGESLYDVLDAATPTPAGRDRAIETALQGVAAPLADVIRAATSERKDGRFSTVTALAGALQQVGDELRGFASGAVAPVSAESTQAAKPAVAESASVTTETRRELRGMRSFGEVAKTDSDAPTSDAANTSGAAPTTRLTPQELRSAPKADARSEATTSEGRTPNRPTVRTAAQMGLAKAPLDTAATPPKSLDGPQTPEEADATIEPVDEEQIETEAVTEEPDSSDATSEDASTTEVWQPPALPASYVARAGAEAYESPWRSTLQASGDEPTAPPPATWAGDNLGVNDPSEASNPPAPVSTGSAEDAAPPAPPTTPQWEASATLPPAPTTPAPTTQPASVPGPPTPGDEDNALLASLPMVGTEPPVREDPNDADHTELHEERAAKDDESLSSDDDNEAGAEVLDSFFAPGADADSLKPSATKLPWRLIGFGAALIGAVSLLSAYSAGFLGGSTHKYRSQRIAPPPKAVAQETAAASPEEPANPGQEAAPALDETPPPEPPPAPRPAEAARNAAAPGPDTPAGVERGDVEAAKPAAAPDVSADKASDVAAPSKEASAPAATGSVAATDAASPTQDAGAAPTDKATEPGEAPTAGPAALAAADAAAPPDTQPSAESATALADKAPADKAPADKAPADKAPADNVAEANTAQDAHAEGNASKDNAAAAKPALAAPPPPPKPTPASQPSGEQAQPSPSPDQAPTPEAPTPEASTPEAPAPEAGPPSIPGAPGRLIQTVTYGDRIVEPNPASGKGQASAAVPIEMVLVPARSWEIGCRATVDGCRTESMPNHTVTLPAYGIQSREVTVDQYDECVREGTCTKRRRGKGCSTTKTSPVNCVTFHQADQFCTWRGWRLPTEAEWEVAARGDTQRRYPWGSQRPSCEQTVLMDLTNGAGCGAKGPRDTASTPGDRSWAGALDMGGNVAEWTSSLWRPYTRGRSFADGSHRVVRGGHYGQQARALPYVYHRNHGKPKGQSPTIGFRCAVTLKVSKRQ